MLNKIKDLSQICLGTYVIRLLITGANIGDAIVIIGLSGLYGYFTYLESKKEPIANKELKERLTILETKSSNIDSKIGLLTLRR